MTKTQRKHFRDAADNLHNRWMNEAIRYKQINPLDPHLIDDPWFNRIEWDFMIEYEILAKPLYYGA